MSRAGATNALHSSMGTLVRHTAVSSFIDRGVGKHDLNDSFMVEKE